SRRDDGQLRPTPGDRYPTRRVYQAAPDRKEAPGRMGGGPEPPPARRPEHRDPDGSPDRLRLQGAARGPSGGHGRPAAADTGRDPGKPAAAGDDLQRSVRFGPEGVHGDAGYDRG